ncbi:hypothetical protein PHET_12016 [Paragonimus heterotremus]|uniref:Uncharacterized protein n=1 Tax=Paragonimus heterotremus TaxID=100268 RepID=A0A8J4SYE8_9TREM|nr:hypothetical protein PHET_12016 [Paragonimus heterotremus]
MCFIDFDRFDKIFRLGLKYLINISLSGEY